MYNGQLRRLFIYYPYSLSMLVAAEYRKCRCNMRIVLIDVKLRYLALAYNMENTVQ